MWWKELFLESACIVCGEETPYYMCDKCRKTILKVREQFFPTEEILSNPDIRSGFFTKIKKKRRADRS